MSNNVFKFKQFSVHHDQCAMKVGTDGVLLGAWSRGGKRLLDIGTGTGLIAMMMAQRFPEAEIVAIDIDEAACLQAKENVANSPFATRVRVMHTSLQQFDGENCFDCIVSNPPFFVNSLPNPDVKRSVARHTTTLSYEALFTEVKRLLTETGRFSAIIPAECQSDFVAEATFMNFSLTRVCAVKTVERKPVKRFMLEFQKTGVSSNEMQTVCLMQQGERSDWYQRLTADFYL